MRFDFFRNINVKAELTLRIRNKSATISSICTELLDRRTPLIPWFHSKYPAFFVSFLHAPIVPLPYLLVNTGSKNRQMLEKSESL